ncbi:MAG: glycerate-2-kinase family protein [Proteobacteria bacterium]|nr:glycerate-2-kinase family protein [Pseudomonadota bacterium]
MNDRELLVGLYREALAAVEPAAAVARALRARPLPDAPVTLLACGKAACAMARGALEVLGPRVERGEVCTSDGAAFDLGRLRVREAGHPLPDERGLEAARAALALARGTRAPSRLLVLLSGGASALWCSPAPGLELADKLRTTESLLAVGAPIERVNAVRKHLSAIKGGRLALASGTARIATLAISDVRGDAPDRIGSGPTAGDPTRFADACAALEEHGLARSVPPRVAAHLRAGAAGEREETPESVPSERYQLVAALDHALEGRAPRTARARAGGDAVRGRPGRGRAAGRGDPPRPPAGGRTPDRGRRAGRAGARSGPWRALPGTGPAAGAQALGRASGHRAVRGQRRP